MIVSVGKLGGLILAPTLWALNTQIGQILPYADCEQRANWSLGTSAVLAAAALGSTVLSYWVGDSPKARTASFLSRLSFTVGLIFVFALVMQGAAAALLNPCQR